jgi:hypothetical protein
MCLLFILLLLVVNLVLTGVFLRNDSLEKKLQKYTLGTAVVIYLLSLTFLVFFDSMNGSYQCV